MRPRAEVPRDAQPVRLIHSGRASLRSPSPSLPAPAGIASPTWHPARVRSDIRSYLRTSYRWGRRSPGSRLTFPGGRPGGSYVRRLGRAVALTGGAMGSRPQSGPDLSWSVPRGFIVLLGSAGAVVVVGGLRATAGIVGPVFLALVLTTAAAPLRVALCRLRLPSWLATLLTGGPGYLGVAG